MAWRRPGDKPISEPMLVFVPTHICVTRPQWVNSPVSTCILAWPFLYHSYAHIYMACILSVSWLSSWSYDIWVWLFSKYYNQCCVATSLVTAAMNKMYVWLFQILEVNIWNWYLVGAVYFGDWYGVVTLQHLLPKCFIMILQHPTRPPPPTVPHYTPLIRIHQFWSIDYQIGMLLQDIHLHTFLKLATTLLI